jgi:alkyl hydroperoxide reductase subunit AhpC
LTIEADARNDLILRIPDAPEETSGSFFSLTTDRLVHLMRQIDAAKTISQRASANVVLRTIGLNPAVRYFFVIDSSGSLRATVARDFYTIARYARKLTHQRFLIS